jgi:hypothetical protein
MNLFWAVTRNVTTVQRFESSYRFKTLSLCSQAANRFRKREVDFAGGWAESFPLREIRHDVFLRTFAAPMALQISAV